LIPRRCTIRTPDGQECRFFYGDYARGRHTEICRLLEAAEQPWKPALCRTCPVPGILRANACPHMILYGRVQRRLGLWQRVRVTAVCQKTRQVVPEPHMGCGQCGREGT